MNVHPLGHVDAAKRPTSRDHQVQWVELIFTRGDDAISTKALTD
ncbi:Unknown protein sequence [Pseudomonas savastanoi pv. phaseolicola]|nr:Unknown protein sequence [Pseudomonas savastanoi pv. phaseolicola]KPB49297.1 Unknown protein sequence [Pseudomonas savastanoi pv. phaseolicola]KPB56253.1 Unknown protein sequence [Pseudomonas savastanoi pv. phaseolicola]KPB65117.1 Unknown protein sequence [Pseudomonas amygdali pv. mellea]